MTRYRTLLGLALACCLLACAMGDIVSGPLPVDLIEEQVVGTWIGQKDAGTFVFASDGTMSVSDLPSDALSRESATSVSRLSGEGEWHIGAPIGGGRDQRNIVYLSLDISGRVGGTGSSMSASKPQDVILLSLGNYVFAKKV
jgi:hypothetical protein